MQHDVALLGGWGLDIGQALPFFQIPGAHQTALGHGAGLIGGLGLRVAPLGAKEAVHPAVLVIHEAHVVDVRVWILRLGNHARLIPETEIVDAVFRFSNREETFPVPALDPDTNHNFPVPLDGTGIESRIDAEAFHQERIGFRVQIVAPFKRYVGVGHDRVEIAFIDAVIPGGIHGVFALDEGFMVAAKGGQAFGYRCVFHMIFRF